MSRILTFLHRMDANAWRAVGMTLLLFATVGAILLIGKVFLIDGSGGSGGSGLMADAQDWMLSVRGHPGGVLVLIALFCVLAFLGAPQFALIAAAVVAFGPVLGSVYSWIATIASASLTFWIGRWFGEGALRRYGGQVANRFSRFVGRNAFLASMIVRIVPTGPFIVVNMAFGVSQARFSHFLAGLALGVIPKIALVAFGGQALLSALQGNPFIAAAIMVAVVALYIPVMLTARKQMEGQDKSAPGRSPLIRRTPKE